MAAVSAAEGVPQLSLQWRKSLARVVFGIIWGVDATFKWTPAFRREYLDLLEHAAQRQPAWLHPWFQMWVGLIAPRVGFFADATAVIETVIALALILGFARKAAYLLTAVFSFLIWSTAEGFGGPYTAGSTDVGTGIVYALAAVFLLIINATAGTSRYSLDAWIERRVAWWPAVAEVGGRRLGNERTPRSQLGTVPSVV